MSSLLFYSTCLCQSVHVSFPECCYPFSCMILGFTHTLTCVHHTFRLPGPIILASVYQIQYLVWHCQLAEWLFEIISQIASLGSQLDPGVMDLPRVHSKHLSIKFSFVIKTLFTTPLHVVYLSPPRCGGLWCPELDRVVVSALRDKQGQPCVLWLPLKPQTRHRECNKQKLVSVEHLDIPMSMDSAKGQK